MGAEARESFHRHLGQLRGFARQRAELESKSRQRLGKPAGAASPGKPTVAKPKGKPRPDAEVVRRSPQRPGASDAPAPRAGSKPSLKLPQLGGIYERAMRSRNLPERKPDTHTRPKTAGGQRDAISQFLERQRSDLGRQYENRLKQPRSDLDTRDQRLRSQLGDFPWRSGETPDSARDRPQTTPRRPDGKRDTMAEFLNQQRARFGRQLENAVTRPRSSTDPRLPNARANAEQARAALKHLPGRDGGPAPRTSTTPKPTAQPSTPQRNSMAEFFRQQRARVERQAANQVARPPSPSLRPSVRPPATSSRGRQPSLSDALRRSLSSPAARSPGRSPSVRPGLGSRSGANRVFSGGSAAKPSRGTASSARPSSAGRSGSVGARRPTTSRSNVGAGSARSRGPSGGGGSRRYFFKGKGPERGK
jgi:hypothetical protein